MKTFWIATALYLSGSIVLFGLMWLLGSQRRRAFIGFFGAALQYGDLDADQAARWAEVHDRQFDSGDPSQ